MNESNVDNTDNIDAQTTSKTTNLSYDTNTSNESNPSNDDDSNYKTALNDNDNDNIFTKSLNTMQTYFGNTNTNSTQKKS